jgi:hypothetical protein
MKREKLIYSVLILIVPITFLTLQAKPRPASVEDEIKDFEQRANAAYEANDLAKYIFRSTRLTFRNFCRKGGQTWRNTAKIGPLTSGEGNRAQKVETSDMHIQVGPSKDTANCELHPARAD